MRSIPARKVCLLVLVMSPTAWAWTVPVEISAPSGSERSTPRIARGNSGTVNVIYLNKGGTWTIYYRQKSAAGNWGAVEQVSTAFGVRPDVAEDSTGRPHVICAQKNPTAYDLYHAYKNGGSWIGGYIGVTSDFEDEPRLVADGLGRVHLIYTRGAVESSDATIKYRVWTSGSWSAETDLGTVNHAYYHRPDLTIDSAGNLHAVWIQDSGGLYHVRYRKNTGGVWGAVIGAGAGSNSTHFFNYARVAVASTSNVCVVWHDDADSAPTSVLKWNYSNNGGATFVFTLSGSDQGQNLYTGHYPQLDSGTTSSVHLISNLEPTEKILVYSKWTGGGSWVTLAQQINSNPYWQGWPDITEDTSGNLHAVMDNPYGGGSTDEHNIGYLTTANDVVPPAPVTSFTATGSHNKVHLSWTNAPDPDFTDTMIRYKTTGFPTSTSDGTLLVDRAAAPGSNDSYDHTGVTNGILYYYTAFAHDSGNLYSTGSTASARPFVPMDRDHDGDVDQSDYAVIQNCLGLFPDTPCLWADFNTDNNVNPADLDTFLDCWSGPDVLYVSNCAG